MENKDFTDKILENTKLNIAMSEFGKEYQMKNKDEKVKKYSYMKRVAAAMLVICLLVVGGVQAKNAIVEYENRNVVYGSKSISDAITNGYVENLDMDYIYSDGVGLKIDSFFMSDNDISIEFNFKMSDGIEIDEEGMSFAYVLYNENNEVYYIDPLGTNRNIVREFAKEKKIKLENGEIPEYWSSSNAQYITYKKDNVIINNMIKAKENFPRAKKLHLKVYGIGYGQGNKMLGGDYEKISNSIWNIELDVPDKFYSSIGNEYLVSKNVENFQLERFYVTDTSTIFIANIKGINGKKVTLYDENGNEYKSSDGYYYTGTNGDRIRVEFPVNKRMTTEKMYIKYEIEGEEKIVELTKK